jgi:hypothetical protein
MDRHFETFQRVYDERFQAKYGFWRPVVARSVTAFLGCGDLHEGFARVRCGDCGHEMLVAFSCKQRCTWRRLTPRPEDAGERRELIYVDIDTFETNF